MKPMYFKLYHNPENKTLTIPRAALQLSGLADAEELILHTGGGYVLAARNALSTWNACTFSSSSPPLPHLCSSSWRYSARKGRNFPSVRTPLRRKMKWTIPA